MPLPRILLASRSPRRRALIGILGLAVQTTATDVDENPGPGEPPEALAARLAREKAGACLENADANGVVVVAADSVVVLDGHPLGKPVDEDDARAMLRALRGRLHQVVTAVALLDTTSGRWHEGLVTTDVDMRPYGEEEIDAYVRGGSPMDKAGAYGIQDEDFGPVKRLNGCYLNVVGLPLCEVARGLAALSYEVSTLTSAPFIPPCHLCHEGARAIESGASLNPLFANT